MQFLTIGEVSTRSGVATSALRYYEERGLIASVRTDARHRRYPQAILRRVAFIVFAQKVGLSLDEVRVELGKLGDRLAPTPREWEKLASNWTSRIDQKIAELERLKTGLLGCIGCGCLSFEACRLANPGDRAAAFGPGPVLWTHGEPGNLDSHGA